MPWRQASHSQKQGRALADQAYDAQQRAVHPALAWAKRLRSSQRWQDVRRLVLQKHPLCADPFGHHAEDGEVILATEVDHVLGLSDRPDLAFTESNLAPLCTACHAKKSGMERAG